MLETKNAAFTPPYTIYFFIVYELDSWSRDLISDCTLKDCLFRDVKLLKNTDQGKYQYSDYGAGFDSHSEFSLPDGVVGKNVIIFGVDTISSVHIDNKRRDAWILGKGPTEGLGNTILTSQA